MSWSHRAGSRVSAHFCKHMGSCTGCLLPTGAAGRYAALRIAGRARELSGYVKVIISLKN